jgi:hypothetical protein
VCREVERADISASASFLDRAAGLPGGAMAGDAKFYRELTGAVTREMEVASDGRLVGAPCPRGRAVPDGRMIRIAEKLVNERGTL